ncbi:MAG TPA: class II aldolase/adducin family protein [Solirubrobacteraceae bacterium]
MLEHDRQAVATVARQLAGAGMAVGTAGNVSVRRGDRIAITSTGATLSNLSADDVSIVDLDGAPVEGAPATSELALHLGAYRRFGTGAVIHAHAPVSTALACVLEELPAVHYQIVALGGPVRVARYATFGTTELADATLDALQDRSAVLMANHGALTIGEDLDTAMERIRLLEWVATVYWQAATIGTPRILNVGQLQAVRDEMARRQYGRLTPAGSS